MAQATTAKFQTSGPFHQDLKARVDQYFTDTGKARRDLPWMYVKTAVILSWFLASYLFLLLVASGPLAFFGGALSLGLAIAGIGFSIQHDANHGGYSESRRVNRALAWTLDFVGGSSYMWTWKHNIFHHSHPNVVGMDADIAIEPLGRLAPAQQRQFLHRFQFIYLWFLYGLLALKWHFVDDFVSIFTGKIGPQSMPPPKGRKLAGLLVGKLVFYTWAFAVPMLFHPVLHVLAAYAVTSFILGLTLASTFQLAHCVEEAEFPELPRAHGENFQRSWAEHQVETTVDFAPDSRLLTWYLGGLNFQVIHHLFPTVCHLHYPALAKIVQATCAEHGVRYHSHPTLKRALASHVRWVQRLGQKDLLAAATV